jgi:hypothetical protein
MGRIRRRNLSMQFANSLAVCLIPKFRQWRLLRDYPQTSCIGGMTNCFVGAYLFPAEDKPKYLLGFGVIAGMCAFGVMVYTLAHVLFRKYIK